MKANFIMALQPAVVPAIFSRGSVLRRKCACGGTPGPSGECEECKKKREAGLQRKAMDGPETGGDFNRVFNDAGSSSRGQLVINDPGDSFEREADRVADAVVSNRHASPPASLQRAATRDSTGVGNAPPIVHEVLSEHGQSLDSSTRGFMESRFNHDFSAVRIHTDARAAESAGAVGALAYTLGERVVFGDGRYAPATESGRRLLAHELSHVLQQRAAGAASAAIGGLGIEPPESAAEREAEAMADRVLGGGKQVEAPVFFSTGLQRKISPRMAEIRAKLAAKEPGEKNIHDVLTILEALVEPDFSETIAALAREDLMERLLANVGEADKNDKFSTLRRIKNAWPRTVTTTVGKTTVTTTVVGSCSPEQFHQIYLATMLAVQWLDRAITRTDAYLKKPGDASTQDVGAALELHFHNTTDRVAAHVRERLTHIRADILGAQPFSIECHGVWDKLCDVAMAYASSEQMTFCNSFFRNAGVTQAETVIHEMAHSQVGGLHITDRGYQADRVLRLLSTAEALTNAESYGLFTQQLGTGKVPSMPAPKDKSEDCPKDWWDWIQFSVARAERWNFNARLMANSLTAEQVRHWDARRQQLLGGTSQGAVDAAKKTFNTLETKLNSSVKFECEPGGGGRCDESGVLTYWYGIWSDFHICPMWRYQPTPEDHIEALLLGLYGYLADVGNNDRRLGYARLAREWSAEAAPSLTQVLGSTLWRSDRLRIVVTPIEPKTPGQDSFTENGSTPHPRMSDRLPLYQTEPGLAVELPFRCRFEFLVDEAALPRPLPFTPPRVSAELHFHDASGKYHHIAPTMDKRPVYQGGGRPLYISGADVLDMTINRNGRLNVKARLEDSDTHFTRVYDDIIQVRADRSAEKPAVQPQVEGCTGWEKNPEGFVKEVASYVAIHEVNPVIDTRSRVAGCSNPHECTVVFPDGLNMTILWGPAARKVIAKWDDQGTAQRRVYDYSCAVGRVKLTPYTPPATK
jgi:hypothetical protein